MIFGLICLAPFALAILIMTSPTMRALFLILVMGFCLAPFVLPAAALLALPFLH